MEILGRGVSSTVRRCVEKDTGKSYAAKIVDVSQDYVDADGLTIREQIMREVDILRQVGVCDLSAMESYWIKMKTQVHDFIRI